MQKNSEIVPNTSLFSVATRLESGKTLKPAHIPQETLILFLKSYLFISDDVIIRLTSAIGVCIEKPLKRQAKQQVYRQIPCHSVAGYTALFSFEQSSLIQSYTIWASIMAPYGGPFTCGNCL